jgi:muramoyltetrapeptide carboxypeptidase
LIKPRRLQAGDRVALVAPASSFKRDDFDAGVVELARLGLQAVYDERIFDKARFVAGLATTRAALIEQAWRDPSISGIIAVRGGYGSAQLLPLLDSDLLKRAAKPFIGYSDVTALLCLHLRHGVVCFHGAMIEGRLARGEAGYDQRSFRAALMEPTPLGTLTPSNLAVLRNGDATGILVGGTLTQLTSLLGTPWAYDPPDGCVLFIEDIGERPYRVDRMLTQLLQSGVVAKARAVVFGEFPSCDEPNGDVLIRHVLESFAAAFGGPVLAGFPSGHTNGPTWTIPLGVMARVVTTPRPALVIEEAAVE